MQLRQNTEGKGRGTERERGGGGENEGREGVTQRKWDKGSSGHGQGEWRPSLLETFAEMKATEPLRLVKQVTRRNLN